MGKKVCVSSLLQAATLNDESKGDLHQILDIKPDTVESCDSVEESIVEDVSIQGRGEEDQHAPEEDGRIKVEDNDDPLES